MQKTLRGPDDVRLELDSSEIYPDDPGNGTPAMVYKGAGCASYTCAECTGMLWDDRIGDVPLSIEALEWLTSDSVQNEIESMYDAGPDGSW